jgi:hypothetical protein
VATAVWDVCVIQGPAIAKTSAQCKPTAAVWDV